MLEKLKQIQRELQDSLVIIQKYETTIKTQRASELTGKTQEFDSAAAAAELKTILRRLGLQKVRLQELTSHIQKLQQQTPKMFEQKHRDWALFLEQIEQLSSLREKYSQAVTDLLAACQGKNISQEKTEFYGIAGPWTRLFARLLDQNIIKILLILLFSLFILKNHKDIHNPEYTNIILGISLLLFPLFYCFIDAGISSLFSNNLGHKLMAVKVIANDGRKLTYRDYLKRNLSWYINALAFGVPLINLITLCWSYSDVRKHNGQAKWDRQYNTLIVSTTERRISRNLLLTFIGIIIYVILMGLSYSVNHVATTNMRKPTLSNQIESQFNELNKELPKRLDEVTILQSISLSSKHMITYTYLLKDKNNQEIPLRDNAREVIFPRLKKYYCSETLNDLRGAGYSITNLYNGADNQNISVTLTPQDCQN